MSDHDAFPLAKRLKIVPITDDQDTIVRIPTSLIHSYLKDGTMTLVVNRNEDVPSGIEINFVEQKTEKQGDTQEEREEEVSLYCESMPEDEKNKKHGDKLLAYWKSIADAYSFGELETLARVKGFSDVLTSLSKPKELKTAYGVLRGLKWNRKEQYDFNLASKCEFHGNKTEWMTVQGKFNAHPNPGAVARMHPTTKQKVEQVAYRLMMDQIFR